MYSEGKKPEGKTLQNPEGTTSTTAKTEIKCGTTCKMKIDEKELEPHNTTIALRENGYSVPISSKKKMKWALKSHRSVNKCKQKRHRRETIRQDKIIRKRRASN